MKTRNTVLGIIVMLFVAGTVHGFDSASGDAVLGNENIQQCRKCHDGSTLTKISPAGKTKKQWTRYFNDDYKKLKKKHADWDSYGYSTAVLGNIHQYLITHSLDSDKPQTCD